MGPLSYTRPSQYPTHSHSANLRGSSSHRDSNWTGKLVPCWGEVHRCTPSPGCRLRTHRKPDKGPARSKRVLARQPHFVRTANWAGIRRPPSTSGSVHTARRAAEWHTPRLPGRSYPGDREPRDIRSGEEDRRWCPQDRSRYPVGRRRRRRTGGTLPARTSPWLRSRSHCHHHRSILHRCVRHRSRCGKRPRRLPGRSRKPGTPPMW